ncbi:hypothetical protein EDB85DRAFT_1890116 [Lactarius pseudohatsudake]|nr:hypothetical protein EDB85DRAFT_1890116 [Lactarius pseudohatsudake]
MSPVRGNLGGVVRVCAWPTLHTNWGARKWVKGGAPLPFPHRHSFARTRFRGRTRPPLPGRAYTHLLPSAPVARSRLRRVARRPPPGRTELPRSVCAPRRPSVPHKGGRGARTTGRSRVVPAQRWEEGSRYGWRRGQMREALPYERRGKMGGGLTFPASALPLRENRGGGPEGSSVPLPVRAQTEAPDAKGGSCPAQSLLFMGEQGRRGRGCKGGG